jgi:hypothetical protein
MKKPIDSAMRRTYKSVDDARNANDCLLASVHAEVGNYMPAIQWVQRILM